jgi:hypothetical protein
MSQERESFKHDCIERLEMLHKSVKEKIADPKNATIKTYLEGYEAGCLMAIEIIKSKSSE